MSGPTRAPSLAHPFDRLAVAAGRPIALGLQRPWPGPLRLLPLGLVALVLAIGGCDDEEPTPPLELSVRVETPDTLVFKGDVFSFRATVMLGSTPSAPSGLAWIVSNPALLDIVDQGDGTATLTAVDTGAAFVIAYVDEENRDSALVTVVQTGQVRWRAATQGGTLTGPSLDEQGRIYVLSDVLQAFSPDGSPLYSEPACWAAQSPAVYPDGSVYIIGSTCIRKHRPDGSLAWEYTSASGFTIGSIDGGPAVTPDGSLVVLHTTAGTDQHIVLSQFTPEGDEVWRDSLAASGLDQYGAPTIAEDGDIYFAWSPEMNVDSLTSVSSDGERRWSAALPGDAIRAGLAVLGDRVYVPIRNAGVLAFDTAGNLLWQGTDGNGYRSSPVVDADGNVYVETLGALVSYSAAGDLRWAADSLGMASIYVAAPTLLADGSLLIARRTTEPVSSLCSVAGADGSANWCVELGGEELGAPAVAADGTILVYTQSPTSLVAVWNRAPALSEGWPTEGGGMGRMRSR